MKYIVKNKSSLIEFLKIHYAGASNTTLKNFFKSGRIYLNGNVVTNPTLDLKPGDEVLVQKEGEKKQINLPFELVYEDDAMLVVVKQPGILTSGEGITKKPTLHWLVNTWIQQKTRGKQAAFVVHRLDKEVGGLVLFAKSQNIVDTLQNNWKKYTKKYLAISRFAPPETEGTIDTWLKERNLKMFVEMKESPGAVHAITHYKWLRFEKKNSVFEVTLDTGKKNQIRVHLAHIGCPIIGDEKYGDDSKGMVRLFSWSIEILHPVSGKKMQWTKQPEPKFFKF
ncbi:MAG: RluA family pseudouridine synthase [Crocinitomicaceae bacterium]|nr:RluA family pseudouridine synthase [Crocinitomicaceae bacterium]MBK8924592.1 RluA family pseudouridine synthase [Crocinitomicaceae bacterium]